MIKPYLELRRLYVIIQGKGVLADDVDYYSFLQQYLEKFHQYLPLEVAVEMEDPSN
jgi:hypothetical protein